MKGKRFTIRRLAALGLALGALATAGAAQARVVDVGGGPQTAPSTAYWQAVQGFYAQQARALERESADKYAAAARVFRDAELRSAVTSPDDRPSVHGADPTGLAGGGQVGASPDDRPGIRGNPADTAQPTSVPGTGAGFDWGDFAIGVGAALGAILGALAVRQLARNRRRLATLH